MSQSASDQSRWRRPCPAGFFKNRAVSQCEPCPGMTTSLVEGSRSCDVCKPGFYRHAFAPDGQAICIQCPLHATTHVGEVAVKPDDCHCGPGHSGYSWQLCARARVHACVYVRVRVCLCVVYIRI